MTTTVAMPAAASSVPPLAPRAAAPVTPGPLSPPVPGPRDRRGVPEPAEQERLAASVGAALRRARASARLSQARLAVLAGCEVRSVERLEAGRIRPTDAFLAALAYALVTPPGWSPQRARAAALAAELAKAAGASLVKSTPGGARRRRRRLRKAQRAARVGAR